MVQCVRLVWLKVVSVVCAQVNWRSRERESNRVWIRDTCNILTGRIRPLLFEIVV